MVEAVCMYARGLRCPHELEPLIFVTFKDRVRRSTSRVVLAGTCLARLSSINLGRRYPHYLKLHSMQGDVPPVKACKLVITG
jgi:hypothetical protein